MFFRNRGPVQVSAVMVLEGVGGGGGVIMWPCSQ